MSAATEEMKARLRVDLSTYMRARQSLEAGVIRSLLAALDNAEALPVDHNRPESLQARFGDGSSEADRRSLPQEDVDAIISSEIRQRMNAAADMERLGLEDRAETLRHEAQIAKRYAG
jgi:uncharacterized protein YqeY